MANKVTYEFPGKSGGTIIYNDGYEALVIINQVAEVDSANAEQVALAKKQGGQLVVEEKAVKKPTKTERKK